MSTGDETAREHELRYAPERMRIQRLVASLLGIALVACASRESVGTRSVAMLGAGVVNDPENKSLRFDLLKFGLESFCREMLGGGVPLRMSDEEPTLGRFYATACNTQFIDEENRKTFVVQFSGEGFASSQQGGRLGFTTTGLVEYAPDFLLHEDSLYVYFRPRVVDATGFETKMIESSLAKTALGVLGVSPDAFGRRVVESQLRRGFTVLRHDASGETEFGMGIIPLGQRPYRPFTVQSEDKRTLANERTEVHVGQQDFVGPFTVEDDDQALYLTLALDGAAVVDALLVGEAAGRTMVRSYMQAEGPTVPSAPALLDEPVPKMGAWKRYVLVTPGRYYLVLDNSAAAGRSAPPPNGGSARVDVLVLLGERP